MLLSDLMWYLDQVPFAQRKLEDVDFATLIVYHVTRSDHVDSIRQHGIRAQRCQQSYERPAAVYCFADRDEITADNLAILGLQSNYKILRVKIPADQVLKHMRWDGLYNVTFGTSRTAVQYLDNIPSSWIVSYDYNPEAK